MQNTAFQTTGQNAIKGNCASTKSSSSTKQRNKTTEENVDPYLQIYMCMISQNQTTSEMQSQEVTDTSPESVTQIIPQQILQDLQSMLKLQGLTDSQSTAVLQSLAETQSTAVLQNMAETQSTAVFQSLVESQSMVNLQSITETQSTTSLLKPTEIQSKTELQSHVNTQESQSYVIENTQKSDEIVSQDGTVTQFSQNLSENVNKDTPNVNLDNTSETAMLTEAINPADKTVVPSNKSSFSEVVDSAEVSSENTEVIVKVNDSPETADKGIKSGEKEVDVSNLQSEITEKKQSSLFELNLKTADKASEPKISNQITSGVKQNLSIGKSEFTVKLNPESLGEITVKLVEESGKTVLTITTASAETAKLINSDLTVLKEAVAHMNVHVNEAVIRTNESQQSNMQQFNMSGQQSSGQNFSGGQTFNRSAYSAYENSDGNFEASDLILGASQQKISSGTIDTYI